ncbi:glucose-6-phosphate dehydrogenase assembly protein OpcA [Conexibacter woesei]|uniref:glucose-6-phosphate dehydrogenase assembly protein OpcA n=1 Tax=Conexibacter woesei TaxID=191495 RepID=UPI000412609B|nr:glucose-6-phosphate dehydrogenase assembly protein OpcA [Conexibacter woesei]
MATVDTVWRARDTNPGEIDAALRSALSQVHRENAGYVPARVLNLVTIVDKQYSGEIANRLRRVGRYHPSRTIVCSVDPRRTTLDAVATISAPSEVGEGNIGLLRETVVVECGTRHLKHLDRIVDPLVVTDLLTCVWAPHGHAEAVDSLLDMSQIVLTDGVDEPEPVDALHRAQQLSKKVYVVDLAWLRSTPWRERIAATFDPPTVRPELRTISAITIRHHPDSAVAALLLVGWLASRLGWSCSPLMSGRGGIIEGNVHARRQDVRVRLEPDPRLQVRGLAGLTLSTASGRTYSLDRGPGGLRAHFENRRGEQRDWTILGASRGEAGILGEGIRQALLRDQTYKPALEAAARLLP